MKIIYQHDPILAAMIGTVTGPASITYTSIPDLRRTSRITGRPIETVLPPHPVTIMKTRTEMAWLGDYRGIIRFRRAYHVRGNRLYRGAPQWGEHVSPNIVRHICAYDGQTRLYLQFLLNVNHNPIATPLWHDDDGNELPDDLVAILEREYVRADPDDCAAQIARRQGLDVDRVVLCRRIHMEGIISLRAGGRNYQRQLTR